MKIFYITAEHFPIGMASTNRMLSLARGYVESNASVKVITIAATTKAGNPNKEAVGTINGIDYEYSSGTTRRGATFIARRWLRVKAYLRALSIIVNSSGRKKGDVLICQLRAPLQICLFYLISRLLGLIYVADQSEYPFQILRLHDPWFPGSTKRSPLARIYAWLYTSWMFKFYDVMLIMTKPLEEYFHSRVRKGARILLVPMTVEMDRFVNRSLPRPDTQEYVAYCGDVGPKDGVPILMRAFAEVSRKFTNLRLYIIGDPSNPTVLPELNKLATELDLADKVVFTGRVSRDEIPRYLCNASILALARPRSLQATGGFPTKLGEYLSTGNPVVVTRVGEIPEYLTDGENAFLSDPDDPKAFAAKLDFALSNRELARRVGLTGRETAASNFDYRVQSRKVIECLTGMGKAP